MFSKLDLKLKNTVIIILSSGFLAFGLYNVHSISGVTEGGILGFTLLLEHHFGISPSVSGFILNAICYITGWKILGKSFLAYSAIASTAFSVFYGIFEQFPRVWPQIADMPLAACILGAVFVGVGAGVSVRYGGATGGDDALAMSIYYLTRVKIEKIYLISDIIVLALSLSYIPVSKIWYSFITVIISGQLIGIVQKIKLPQRELAYEDKKI